MLLLLGFSNNASGQSKKHDRPLKHLQSVELKKLPANTIITKNSLSQEIKISGTIKDDKGNPLVGADVELRRAKDSTLLGKDLADFDGKYVVAISSSENTDTYLLTVYYLGKKQQYLKKFHKQSNGDYFDKQIVSVPVDCTPRIIKEICVTGYVEYLSQPLEPPGTKTIKGDGLPHSFRIEDLQTDRR